MGIRGRFAPTPSGRMHLGNLLAALLAWLDARSGGGELVLRTIGRAAARPVMRRRSACWRNGG